MTPTAATAEDRLRWGESLTAEEVEQVVRRRVADAEAAWEMRVDMNSAEDYQDGRTARFQDLMDQAAEDENQTVIDWLDEQREVGE